MLLPFFVVNNDLLIATPDGTQPVRSCGLLEDVLVSRLAPLSCTVEAIDAAVSLGFELVTGVLQHSLDLHLLSLLAMDIVLEILDHAMSVM
jgi:hypothetical protein